MKKIREMKSDTMKIHDQWNWSSILALMLMKIREMKSDTLKIHDQ